jgi:hypothetical protein
MAVLRFPTASDSKRGPRPIHVCAPSHEDRLYATRKIGLGYSRDEARTRFYEGGLNQFIETRTFTLATAPKWLKLWLMTQLEMHVQNGQPLSPVDEEARERLGPDPYKYGKGLRREKKR